MTSRMSAYWVAGVFLLSLDSYSCVRAEEPKPAEKSPSKEDRFELVIPGQILPVDAPDKVRNLPCKVHVIRMDKGKAFVIEMTTKEFDSYLRIEDSTGKPLAENDDGGDGLNARLKFMPPKDDTYLVIATSCSGGAGMYTLAIKSFTPPVVKPVVMETPKAGKVSQVQTLLSRDDPEEPSRNQPSKLHLVELKAGKTYVIDMISNQFDTFLRLESPEGAQIAQDDDGGGNLNSRIVHQPNATGQFRIIATTFNGRLGQYTLRITEQ